MTDENFNSEIESLRANLIEDELRGLGVYGIENAASELFDIAYDAAQAQLTQMAQRGLLG